MEKKFVTLKSLSDYLKKDRIWLPESTAKVLLNCFLENYGCLEVSEVVSNKLCTEEEFTLWRREMIAKKWLIWNEGVFGIGEYSPGKNLIIHVNKEKFATKEIATKDEFVAFNLEFQDLKERCSKMEATMLEIYELLKSNDLDPSTHSKIKKIVGKSLYN